MALTNTMFYLPCLLLTVGAAAFAVYETSEPTQCANFMLMWSEGVPPYEVDLVPLHAVGTKAISDIVIVNTTSTSLTMILPFPNGSSFVILVSDMTGYGSLLVSEALVVQESADASCLSTSPPGTNFTVDINPLPPIQCQGLEFEFTSDFSLPLILSGFIPGGDAWEMLSPLSIETSWPPGWSTSSVDWIVDVPSGTQAVFLVGDGTGRAAGGWTALETVGSSSDPSCLSLGALTSTGLPATVTVTSTAVPSSPSSNNTGSPDATGPIVGGIVGGMAGMTLVIVLVLFMVRRWNVRRRQTRLQEKAFGLRTYSFHAGTVRTTVHV